MRTIAPFLFTASKAGTPPKPCLRLWATMAALLVLLQLAAITGAMAGDAGMPPPPIANVVDRIGMNLTTGDLRSPGPSISIGPEGQGGLTFQAVYSRRNYHAWVGMETWESWESSIKHVVDFLSPYYSVTVLGKTEQFMPTTGGGFMPAFNTGGTLVKTGSNYTYTSRDGTVTQFTGTSLSCGYWCTDALASTITKPNGETWTFTWRMRSWAFYLSSVTTNLGYQLKVNFGCSSPSSAACYELPDSVMLINNAVEYCDPAATSCSMSNSWPTLTFGGWGTPTRTVTDPMSHTWTVAISSTSSILYYYLSYIITQPTGQYINWLFDIERSTAEESNRRVTDGTNTWYYTITPDPNDPGSVNGHTVAPNGVVREISTYAESGLPSHDTLNPGQINAQTHYDYHYNTNTLALVIRPDGGRSDIWYSDNGNLQAISNIGPGMPAGEYTGYGITCDGSNYKNCNKRTYTVDGAGNVTTYQYSSVHGGLEVTEGPAVNGVKSRTEYTYASHYAWYKDSGGSIVQAAVPVYLVSSSKTCTTANTCANTAAERVTEFTYQSGSASTASNLLQTQTVVRAGDNSISSTAQTSYDMYGNVETATAPNSGVTRYFYDADGRGVGVVQPDPDGGSGNPYPATKITYDGSGRVLQTEQGTVPSQSRSDFDNNFSSLVQNASVYDSTTGDKIKDTASLNGTAQSVTQYAYDAGGRLLCTAVRQNPAAFGSLPSDACTQSSNGSYGYDLISKTYYDAANRIDRVETGVGSGAPVTVVKNGYDSTYPTLLRWVEDGKGNRSQYEYDSTGQIYRIYFPDPATPSTYNSSDYEEYFYDGNYNMTSKRLRSGAVIGMQYDALNRVKLKDMPSGNDTHYTYDMVGNLLSARYGSTSGYGTIFAWDALGRKVTETSYTSGYNVGITSTYDGSGNRVCLRYPDGQYIKYAYDTLNRMTQVEEHGSSPCNNGSPTVLAAYSYDGLGRVTGISRGSNPASTAATYQASSQSWTLAQNLTSGQAVTFGMDYTPAGQVTARSISNGSYRYGVGSAVTTNYCANGLNQYVASTSGCSGGGSYAYDSLGNMTGNPSHSFGYDLENKLTCVDASCATMSLAYDPLGRLLKTTASSAVQDYLYDGTARLVEMDASGNILRRYVPGRGVDETLVWYEGSGLGTRAWLHADQQGSVVAASDSSGVSANIHTYGPFGEGGIGGAGPALRYTGQAQLAAAGLYYYKARVYDPVAGRFLQTDPIGYSAGMNLYAYVMNDPANLVDPTGLDTECQSDDKAEKICVVEARLYKCLDNGMVIYSQEPCRFEPDALHLPRRDETGSGRGANGNMCPSGPVVFAGVGFEGYLGFGGGLWGGGYAGLDSGEVGLWGAKEGTSVFGHKDGGGFGWGGSAGLQVGWAKSTEAFAGNYSVVGIGVLFISVNYAYAQGRIWPPIAVSVGPSVNLMPSWPVPVPASGHYSAGNTKLAPLSKGKCE